MTTCGPGSRQDSTKSRRTTLAGTPKRSASPPHTPAIQASSWERVSTAMRVLRGRDAARGRAGVVTSDTGPTCGPRPRGGDPDSSRGLPGKAPTCPTSRQAGGRPDSYCSPVSEDTSGPRSLKTAAMVLRALRLLGDHPEGLSPAEIGAYLGKSSATARYMVNTLVEAGYARRDASGRARLGSA